MDFIAILFLILMTLIIVLSNGNYFSQSYDLNEKINNKPINENTFKNEFHFNDHKDVDEDDSGGGVNDENNDDVNDHFNVNEKNDFNEKLNLSPAHITNQHPLLRKLSQAYLNKKHIINKSENKPLLTHSDKSKHIHHHQYNHNHYNNRHLESLRRVMLKNESVTCNDGTKAGYYIRESLHGSKKWIIFLEGGWYCFSTISCNQRWLRMRHLMSSAHWPEYRSVNGILSSNSEENPYWWDANHVFIPYCSSDGWAGDVVAGKRSIPSQFSFLGKQIIEQVVLELLSKGLFNAKSLLLTGSSSGAVGVLINLDRIADLLRSFGSSVNVRGIADSGWFLDNEPFDLNSFIEKPIDSKNSYKKKIKPCTDTHSCAPVEMVKQGIKLWNGQVPQACRDRFHNEPWRCFFGYHIYTTLKTPLFIVQWMFDEAQMTANNVATPISKVQWNYVHRLGKRLRWTLENATAVFSPSCMSHIFIIKRDWMKYKINGINLPQAIRCWEQQQNEHNHHDDIEFVFSPVFQKNSFKRIKIDDNQFNTDFDFLSDSPKNDGTWTRFNKQISSHYLSSGSLTGMSQSSKPADHITIPLVEKLSKKKRKRKHKKRHHNSGSLTDHNRNKRSLRSKIVNYHHDRHRLLLHSDLCSHHLIDKCSWPQCNPTCPKLHNPFTGEEIEFRELLKSFGFNLGSLASAFGVKEEALNEMNQEALIEMLTH